MPIQTGTSLGAYQVQEFLGQGAMGTVYKAYHPGLARTAAVKVLLNLDPDSETSARFQREAQAIAAMRHPHILNVYDFGEYEGSPYMIVEYMPGGSLADLAKGGHTLTREEALDRLSEIGSALDYAHANGIVHRDVKPANVLTDRNGAAVLADFGLAKMMQSSAVKTMSGTTTGTPAYMSPEQVTGSAVGPGADVYAFTTMAYEYLTGQIPFEGEGTLELMYAHVQRVPPLASSKNPDLNSKVDEVLNRGLAKDPEARWHSCSAMMAALRAALKDQEVSVEDTARVATLAPVAAAVTVPESSGTAVMAAGAPALGAAAPKRHRLRWIALGVVALLLVVGAGAVALSALAQRPTVSLSAATVEAGGRLSVRATGYHASETLNIFIASDTPRLLASPTADGSGQFSVEVDIPQVVSTGSHEIRVCDSKGTCTSSPVRVTARTAPRATPTPAPTPTRPAATPTPAINPAFTATPNPLRIGAGFKVDGTGYASGKVIIQIVQAAVAHPAGEADSLPNGSFTYQGTVPNNIAIGAATLRVCNGPLPGTNCKDEPVTIAR